MIKLNKTIKIIIVSLLLIILVIVVSIIYNVLNNRSIINNAQNNFQKVTKVSEKPCYVVYTNGLGLGTTKYKKIKNCKKIEYRGIKEGNYYTYFVIERGLKKQVLENFSSQEKYFPEVNKIIEDLELKEVVNDIYVSGLPNYSNKGSEFTKYKNVENVGLTATIDIYVNQKLKEEVNEILFSKYMYLNNHYNKNSTIEINIHYTDNYKIQLGFYSWITLYKDGKIILDSNREYDITKYDELINRLT